MSVDHHIQFKKHGQKIPNGSNKDRFKVTKGGCKTKTVTRVGGVKAQKAEVHEAKNVKLEEKVERLLAKTS